MDSSIGREPQAPPPSHCRHHHFPRHTTSIRHQHHHHHFLVSPHCPLHSHLINLRNHSPTCPVFSSLLPQSQNPDTLVESSVPFPTNPEDALAMPNEQGAVGMEEEDGDDDPVFVLTDEWMEFFAKSEAKRRLAKKQARRKGKKMEQ